MSKLYRAINKNETIRFFIINSTEIIEEMRKTHNTSTTATAALGRLTTMAAIMGSDIKNEKEKIILKIKGDGPSGMLISEINSKGNIKSYIQNPQIDIPSIAENSKLDVGSFVGKNGALAVIHDFGFGEPYTGQTSLISGEIAEDFANYFYQSDQLPTVVTLGVLVDTDYSVKSAGGIFIQALPGYTDEDIDMLEKCINNLPSVSSLFNQYKSPEEILNIFFKEMEVEVLEIEDRIYKCDCNRDRIENALLSIGEGELNKIIEEDHHIELTCSYCNKKYDFSEEEIKDLLEKARI